MTAIAEGLTLEDTELTELTAGLRGDVIGRDDPTYDQARKIWNGSIDKRPALIARCAGVADVMSAVKFAQQHGLRVAVRSGGHSFPGLSVADDAFVIDLSLMKGVRVDPYERTARVQAGVLLGELDRETQAFGLAAPSGIVTHTGVAGLTLGGGIGWIMRKHGLSVDQLRRIDVVTAEGELVKASPTRTRSCSGACAAPAATSGSSPSSSSTRAGRADDARRADLLADGGLRGGAALLPRVGRGCARRADDDRHPPQGAAASVRPGRTARQTSRDGRAVLDRRLRGRREVHQADARVRQQDRRRCVQKPYLTHQAMFDPGFVPGRWYYFRCRRAELSDEMIDITVEHSLQIKSPLTSFPIWQMGGAVSRPSGGRDRFRRPQRGIHVQHRRVDGERAKASTEERDWVRNFWSALEKCHSPCTSTSSGDEEGDDRIRAAYGPEKYDRLKALKRKWDPDNFFRINQNISPD